MPAELLQQRKHGENEGDTREQGCSVGRAEHQPSTNSPANDTADRTRRTQKQTGKHTGNEKMNLLDTNKTNVTAMIICLADARNQSEKKLKGLV